MDDLVSLTKEVLLQQCLLQAGDYIIVGVSGGPDSMALLDVLVKLHVDLEFGLAAAHVHHGLRTDADDDAELVRRWCQAHEIELFERRLDLNSDAAALSMSIEEAGRELRREFFEECREVLLQKTSCRVFIALAHHQRDQAETLINNLGRGSGLSGLAGMKVKEDSYLRPFLRFDDDILHEWLNKNDIPWRHDHTNFETVYTRNRIRHMLLPCWQETIGYDPVPLIARASENLAVDEDCLEQMAQSVFAQVYSVDEKSLNRNDLLKQHTAIQIRVLRLFFQTVSGKVKDLTKKHLNLMQAVLQSQAGPFDLPYNLSIRLYGNKILLDTRSDNVNEKTDEDWQIPLRIPGITKLPQRLGSIEAVMIEYNRDFRYNSEMNCFRDIMPAGTVVRLRRPGDHIRPAGRQGTRTLKKFMNEERIDPKHRNCIPVIAAGSEIIWLPEHACGERFICSNGQTGEKCVRLIWHHENCD